MKKNNLSKLRKKLDALDEKLLVILKKRVNLVNQVLRSKKYKNLIVDKKRIREIHKTIRKKSLKNKIVIGYVGTHGMAHNLDFIVNLLNEHFSLIKSRLPLLEKINIITDIECRCQFYL